MKLKGARILITGGPTVEPIDPVRALSNKSSGKMGLQLCLEAANRGCRVSFIYGPGSVDPPPHIDTVRVKTADEMFESVSEMACNNRFDLVILAAAVSDYKPVFVDKKIRSGAESLTIDLKPTRKIIDEVKRVSPDSILVAFKAEFRKSDEELKEAARKKLKEADADMVVANDISREGAGFDHDTNEVIIVTREKVKKVPVMTKEEVSMVIFDEIEGLPVS